MCCGIPNVFSEPSILIRGSQLMKYHKGTKNDSIHMVLRLSRVPDVLMKLILTEVIEKEDACSAKR